MKRSKLCRRAFLTGSAGILAGGAAVVVRSQANPAATSSMSAQSEEGVVCHRDVHKADLMNGFPPPKDRRVTIDNWTDTTDNLRWTHLNTAVVFKSVPVDKGDGPVWVLPRKTIEPAKLDSAQVLWGKAKHEAKRISVADWLRRSETDCPRCPA